MLQRVNNLGADRWANSLQATKFARKKSRGSKVYGLPKNVDWNFLVGAILEQICFGKHNIQFHFDREISISVMSSLRLDGAESPTIDFGELATTLCALLGEEITAAIPSNERAVSIRIGNRVLELIDDSDQFESFVITAGSKEYVV